MPDNPLAIFFRKLSAWLMALLGRAVKNNRFRYGYLMVSLLVLLAGSTYWAILGAHLQMHNADQLSDPYLFSNFTTFHGAVFPTAHTFLLKWPIFWVLGLFGITATSLTVATVTVVLITVLALAYIVSRIERRPLVLGTIFLSLSLALLLVPAQPYTGGILPVNMAMLTTRNLEYAVYVAALALLIKTTRYKSKNFVAATLLLGLLIASDKLFLSLSAGGALLALIVYSLVRNWVLVTFATRWLVGSVLATAGASLLLTLIKVSHITHFAGASSNPYALTSSARGLFLSVVYAISGLLTITGANPAFDNRIVAKLPSDMLSKTLSLSGLVHLVALGILAASLVLTWKFISPMIRVVQKRSAKLPAASQLSVALIASSIAAFGIFIATDHYYAVDARYLAIAFFTLPIVAATVLRRIRWQRPARLVLLGIVLYLGSGLAVLAALGTHNHQVQALSPLDARNELVAQALKHHKVDVLVGDYWRVLPIKLASQNSLNTDPLGNCTQPVQTLTSSAWQPDLSKHSFAYLITFDGNLTNFPACNLAEVTRAFGRPNATQLIAGTIQQPKEALLFYDHGRHLDPPTNQAIATPPLLPVAAAELPGVACTEPTTMNVVAHEDDDLLFMNPDLLHDIRAGRCIRTVYLTAGDSGSDRFYWLSRQLGAEAAYSKMLGSSAVWVQRTVILAGGKYATVASPADNTKVSLIFMNLPDGNVHGDGFSSTGDQSLAKLRSGTIANMRTVDDESSYSSSQLTDALVGLMSVYQPSEIHTQANVPSEQFPDHSDHIATGEYAAVAASQYDVQHFGGAVTIPVSRYIGYPIHGYDQNVEGEDLAQKEAAFLAYAHFDGDVCHSMEQCSVTPTYSAYLSREYQDK